MPPKAAADSEGGVKRSRRDIVPRRPGDDLDSRWSTTGPKVVIIDERRDVMRNLPDPKLFPGKAPNRFTEDTFPSRRLAPFFPGPAFPVLLPVDSPNDAPLFLLLPSVHP